MPHTTFRFTLRHRLAALSLSALSAMAWAQTEPVPPEPEPAEAITETILVAGQRPWSRLVESLEGRSCTVGVRHLFAVAEEDGVAFDGSGNHPVAVAGIFDAAGRDGRRGIFRQMTMLPFAIGFKKNPDGAELKDLLPEPVYARWQVLKKKYIGDDDGIERERPIFAADTLFRKGLEQAGLGSGGREVRETIEKLAKKNKLKMTSTVARLEVDDPVRMLRDFKKTPLDDVACFANTLARLEDDIDAMRLRANAWAKGDLEAIQKISYADRDGACNSAILNSALIQSRPGLKSVQEKVMESWVAAAEKSLAANASTFATLSLKDLLDPKAIWRCCRGRGMWWRSRSKSISLGLDQPRP